jgi:ribosomal protein S18 acetylase RimI-like enzyme
MQQQSTISIQRITSSNENLINHFIKLLSLQNNQSEQEAKQGILDSLVMYDFLSDTNTQSMFYLALIDNHPGGYIAIQRIPKADSRGGFLFVDELYVNEQYRKQGIATALMEHAKQLCHSSSDVAGVRLLCRIENENAQSLYRKCDFNLSETYFGQYKK